MSTGIGIEFCWLPSRCGLYWNEIADKLAKQGAMKNMSEISYNNLQLLYHETVSILEKTMYQELQKSKSAIPSCSRYSAILSNIQVTSKIHATGNIHRM